VRIRPDVLIFSALLAGSAWAVATQVSRDPLPAVERAVRPPMEIGDRVDDFELEDVTGGRRRLSEFRGRKATVLYFWSIDCPCVDAVETRIKHLFVEYEAGKEREVRIVAVDSHPEDTKEAIMEKMTRLRAPYLMLVDPTQEVARRLGAYQATEIVVLDANQRIRYRGAIDDALVKPKTPYVKPALDAILAGARVEPSVTTAYGCPFPGFEGYCAYR
jgi:peroxiredoxin